MARHLAVIASVVFAPAALARSHTPHWLEIHSGTQAYTGDDGGGVSTLTICNSPDAYTKWLDGSDAAGKDCVAKPRGIPVTIISDQATASDFGSTLSLDYIVGVRADDGTWAGWTNPGVGLQPRIPSGTRLVVEDAYPMLLAPQEHAATDVGTLLPAGTVLAVMTQYPSSEDRDLQIRVLRRAGAVPGTTGWIYSMYTTLPGGDPILFRAPASDEAGSDTPAQKASSDHPLSR